MALAARMDLDGITADIRLHAKLQNGLARTLTFKNVELKQLTR